MHLNDKIKAVNNLFVDIDKTIIRFKKESNISRFAGCGDCCTKNNIEATVLEFLPAAYHVFINKKYVSFLERLESNTNSRCIFYNPFVKDGFCEDYKNRGLICRLFGFSVRINKYGDKTLVTCKKIKENTDLTKLNGSIKFAPEISSYYLKLFGIDPKLSVQFFPINTAIKKALEIILLNYQYKKRRA